MYSEHSSTQKGLHVPYQFTSVVCALYQFGALEAFTSPDFAFR